MTKLNDTAKALIVFVKNPKKGYAKTRIAKDVGDDKALDIYLSLLEHTRLLAVQVDAHRFVFYSDFIDSHDAWYVDDFEQRVQSDGDLGHRMFTAFQELTQDHEKTMIIGSDCLQLTPQIIEDGYIAMDGHDAVIGPSEDGGYYMLGMKQSDPTIFEDINWSTDEVFQETIKRFMSLGWHCAKSPLLSDVDYIQDWDKYKHLLNS